LRAALGHGPREVPEAVEKRLSTIDADTRATRAGSPPTRCCATSCRCCWWSRWSRRSKV